MNFSDNPRAGSADFIKLNLGSKDFLLVDSRSSSAPLETGEARRLAGQVCPRRTGVGAAVLLLLKEGEGGVPHLQEFCPGREDLTPGFDSMLAAGKYLFDTAMFGVGPIPLETPGGRWQLEPLDSNSLRISLGKPTPALQTAPGKGYRLQLLRCTSLFFAAQSGHGYPESRKAVKYFMKAEPSAVPVLVHLHSREELKIKLPRGMAETDVVETSGLAALAAFREGFCSHRTVVRCRKTALFVEINPQTEELKVTASLGYVFSGTVSLS